MKAVSVDVIVLEGCRNRLLQSSSLLSIILAINRIIKYEICCTHCGFSYFICIILTLLKSIHNVLESVQNNIKQIRFC